MNRTLAIVPAVALVVMAGGNAAAQTCTASSYVTQSLSGTSTALDGTRILRFAQLSDIHLFDDDASAAITGTELETALEPSIGNGSAQRFQDEYTDEVLNAMEKTINACNAQAPIAFMIATGDNTDHMTLNENRRFIDNLDGVSGQPTAYEANCGYLTNDSNEKTKLALPACTADLQATLAPLLEIPTGRMAPDSQSPVPDPDDPTYQLAPTRSARQIAETTAASAQNLSYVFAAGLPPDLRCKQGDPGCGNVALDVPYYAVFGNHDGALRGTLTSQKGFQAGAKAHGRYWFESQREWINEFFFTQTLPGPVGHGFGFSANLLDEDDRNDGWYAFDVAGGQVRMIVMNTLYDGVRQELHQDGATGTTTGGHVRGNEATNPIGLETGVMSQEQFDWVSAELTAAQTAGQAILAFSHHPDRSFSERRLGFAADGGKTAVQLDNLLGSVPNFVAHIAGHTHEHLVSSCKPGACPIGGSGGNANPPNAFWRIETASLIDWPQEGRIIELWKTSGGKWALKLTVIEPDQTDPTAALSRELSEAEAICNVSQMLGGPLSSGPYDQARLETALGRTTDAVTTPDFCRGDLATATGPGQASDRDLILLP